VVVGVVKIEESRASKFQVVCAAAPAFFLTFLGAFLPTEAASRDTSALHLQAQARWAKFIS
jgi:hypothetical protein